MGHCEPTHEPLLTNSITAGKSRDGYCPKPITLVSSKFCWYKNDDPEPPVPFAPGVRPYKPNMTTPKYVRPLVQFIA